MNDLSILPLDSPHNNDEERGARAAQLIWDDAESIEAIVDPRTSKFANAVIEGLALALESSSGAVKKVIRGAAAAAEDLNVDQFQGLIEVIQNADDLRAHAVRFALRDGKAGRELLIVHDGSPVQCQHVLGMALPFLTTKTHRTDQRGRFGIGLKTLKRIARGLSIHSMPYHFSGDQLSLRVESAESPLPGFYDPARDTLVVLDLKEGFNEAEFAAWFNAWEDDGLIFLSSVSRFAWCRLSGETVGERLLKFSPWRPAALTQPNGSLANLECREVNARSAEWMVWRAAFHVPTHLHPAHKTRSDTTSIAVAVPRDVVDGHLYIGFKTRVPVDLSFSIDAQFDPSTAREALIENDWNEWLIGRCGDVLAEVASCMLLSDSVNAWRLVPLPDEHIGTDADRWLRPTFDASFEAAREQIGDRAVVQFSTALVGLDRLAYEDEELTGLLTEEDMAQLVEGKHALAGQIRDERGRWRAVLDSIDVSTRIGTNDLLGGFSRSLFRSKPPEWWVKAARVLVENHDGGILGVPIWLSDNLGALSCRGADETARPLILGGELSPFAVRWRLLDRLHWAYSEGEDASLVVAWLNKHAAFRSVAGAATELAAFAERFRDQKLEIADSDLRELRDRFDEVGDLQAEELGLKVGETLLLDGFVFKAGKMERQKVSPVEAYLCKTLDSAFSFWPTAAGTLPGIPWVAARYEEQLKTGATRHSRRRADGKMSRGPRRFLMLLGAETAPRLKATGLVRWGGPTRMRELRAAGAEQVPLDYVCPDLQLVFAAFAKSKKKDLRIRGPALFKTLARAWDRLYANRKMVASAHEARVYVYERASVTADWLIALRETPWVAVGKGELVQPNEAVIKTLETQTLYASSAFAIDVDLSDVSVDLASSLGLVTSVRVSDLVGVLRDLRDSEEQTDGTQIMQVYRNIAKHVPNSVAWNTRIGDVTVQDLRVRFSEGAGLVHIGAGVWKSPTELFRGQDIFHDRSRFVPGGPAYAALWKALGVREPSLDDCMQYLKALAGRPYTVEATAALIDIYRHMEPLLEHVESRHKTRLKAMPLYCGDAYQTERPIFFVEDAELRDQLAKALPQHRFWTPPCDLRDLPLLVSLLNVAHSEPTLVVTDHRASAEERGDGVRQHFVHAIDHLSNELAVNDPQVRQRIAISWEELRKIPLFVYSAPVAIRASNEALGQTRIPIELHAVITRHPRELHVWEEALPRREYGGRAIASLFSRSSRRSIEAEWVVAWQEGSGRTAEPIRLAADEEHEEAMRDTAAKINAAPKKKIEVSQPGGKEPAAEPRKLKEQVGPILGATIAPGSPPKPPVRSGRPKLHDSPPPCKPRSPGGGSGPLGYSLADLEQRGWELLVQALETSADQVLVDFRNRHGVGADGVVDWKTFVEMKATGRNPQYAVEMSNAEYERAKERGNDFILALVSGLEGGYLDEVRLIIDPANRATVRPLNGVKLVALTEAPSVVIQFGEAGSDGDG